mgnify:CR=1 FL=1
MPLWALLSTLWLRLRGDEAGQAMAEYAIVTAALMGGLLGMSFAFLPEFIRAFQAYYDSFYVILNLPFP